MNVDYLLLAGIWLGPVKPDMQTILQPVLQKIKSLHTEIHTPQGVKELKAKLLLGVFDLPAKAAAVNMMQYNGKYGCLYCLDEGVHVSHRRIYLPSERHKPRHMSDVLKCAEEAIQSHSAVFGVKGHSVLSSSINIVTSVPIDYMHAILEGITKSLLASWFDSKNHKFRFYLGRQINDMNRSLLRIKPPHEFRRTPRPIETAKFWKACEYRAWLLFYSVPVLVSANFPPDYLNHYCLLVSAMHILLNDCISNSQLEMANLMLVRFYELMPALYPDTMCTLNIHSVIHLCDCVRRWGPLWCYSTFGFENLNGYIKKHCHGTRNVLPQLIQGVRMRQSLPLLKKKLKLKENSDTMEFLDKICGDLRSASGPLGKIVHATLTRVEMKSIQEAGLSISTSKVPTFPRYRRGNLILSVCKTNTTRNNSVCRVEVHVSTPTLCELFGSIQKFCLIDRLPVAIVALFENTKENIISIPHHQLSLLQNDHKAAQIFDLFAYKVKKLSLSKKLIALSAENIIEKCIHIPVKHSPTDIVIVLPNVVEHH